MLQVPCAYKRNNQQRQPGWVDLPKLPDLTPEEIAALPPASPNTPQQQPGWVDQPYTANPAGNPGQAGGYLPPLPTADPGYQVSTPNFAPPSKGTNRRNNNGGGGGGYVQPNGYPPLNDPYWGPPPSQQSGGWASRTGPGRYNNNNNNNFNRNNGGFQGFSSDPTTDLLLQDLEGFGYGMGSDRWLPDEELVEVPEDTSPKYVNGKRVMVNRDIEAPQVRVQDAAKAELGVMATDEARALAQQQGVDVVLINEGGDPPVVRLVNFGKYKFEIERAAKQKQKSSKGTETKEVRLRPVTEAHDYEVKVASARKFLSKGSKVKLTMQFSGRELRFKDQGKEMMLKLIEDLSSVSKMDAPLSLRPATFSVTLSPLK
uniref:Translation initiation factor IF-3 n=1 Tax=Tetradesmus obliquus TaxID=3088 RepID=A0A383VQ51_TETOB|eukprot:jgi/Sobl393_1/2004/SZX67645.1